MKNKITVLMLILLLASLISCSSISTDPLWVGIYNIDKDYVKSRLEEELNNGEISEDDYITLLEELDNIESYFNLKNDYTFFASYKFCDEEYTKEGIIEQNDNSTLLLIPDDGDISLEIIFSEDYSYFYSIENNWRYKRD